MSNVQHFGKSCLLWLLFHIGHSSTLTNVFSIQQPRRRRHLWHTVFIATSNDVERHHHSIFQVFSPCRCVSASPASSHLGRALGLIHARLQPRSPGMSNCYSFSLDCYTCSSQNLITISLTFFIGDNFSTFSFFSHISF